MACGKLKRMNRDGEAGGEATPMRVFLSYARLERPRVQPLIAAPEDNEPDNKLDFRTPEY
jgi:hypothetical protein